MFEYRPLYFHIPIFPSCALLACGKYLIKNRGLRPVLITVWGVYEFAKCTPALLTSICELIVAWNSGFDKVRILFVIEPAINYVH
jgi:hypothetical protein